ncbi:MAG TPA: helix-turn-helix transcriptional regulator [bacterium]|nr:helix-turn-helix transcriptional regulator [bacterium]
MKNVLKTKRLEAGLKQYELAFLLGCSASHLSRVESGQRKASEGLKREAANLFDLKVGEIFGDN